MALHLNLPSTIISFKHNHKYLPSIDFNQKFKVSCIISQRTVQKPVRVERRSSNYQQNIWDHDMLLNLKCKYKGPAFDSRVTELKKLIKHMLEDRSADQLFQLELIDDIERLGLGYHFENEIKTFIEAVQSSKKVEEIVGESLHGTALWFRLLRQHGCKVSQDVFKRFQDSNGNFKECIQGDIKGLLGLYEASYLGVHEEHILDRAKTFTEVRLKDLYTSKHIGEQQFITKLVSHALELPRHWRMQRFEARWYMDVYKEKQDMVPALLDLAKLDFNILQSLHQEELADLIRWWKNLGLISSSTSFTRDRIVESYVWALGMAFEPEFVHSRKVFTKLSQLVSVVDDVYDIYGSLEELEQLTKSFERWDTSDLDQLPYPINLCYLAFHNTVNEMAYETLKQHKFDSLPYLKQAWGLYGRSVFKESKLYYEGSSQTLNDYVKSSFESLASTALGVHIYFTLGENCKAVDFETLAEGPEFVRHSGLIVRFMDDLATSKGEQARGDVPKSVECYAREKGVSEEDASKHVRDLINDSWKNINDTSLSKRSIKLGVNMIRAAQFMYQFGDGYGAPTSADRERIISLLVEPVSISI